MKRYSCQTWFPSLSSEIEISMSRGPFSLRPESGKKTENLLRHFAHPGPCCPRLRGLISVSPLPPESEHQDTYNTLTTLLQINILPHFNRTLKIYENNNVTFVWHKNTGKQENPVLDMNFQTFIMIHEWKRKMIVLKCFGLDDYILRSRSIKILKCKQTFLLQNQIWQILI